MNWTEFDAVFRGKADYTLDHKVVEAITRQRKEAGTLYFDKICSSIGYNQGRFAPSLRTLTLTLSSLKVIPS